MSDKDWWRVDVFENSIAFHPYTRLPERTWMVQNHGSAIAYCYPYVYGELGNHSQPYWDFRRFPDPGDASPEGEQGSGTNSTARLGVTILSTPSAHRFCVRADKPGPVSLRLFDPSGKIVDVMRASAPSGKAELVWNHKVAPSGVYLYMVESGAQSVSGKLTLVR